MSTNQVAILALCKCSDHSKNRITDKDQGRLRIVIKWYIELEQETQQPGCDYPHDAKHVGYGGRYWGTLQERRAKETEGPHYDRCDNEDQRCLQHLCGPYSPEEEDQAKKWDRGSYQQKGISQPGNQFARYQFKGGSDEHDQRKLDKYQQCVETIAQRAHRITVGGVVTTDKEKSQQSHHQQVTDKHPDGAFTAQP